MIELLKYVIVGGPIIGMIIGTILINKEENRILIMINNVKMYLRVVGVMLILVDWNYVELNGHLGSNNIIKIMELLVIGISLIFMEMIDKGKIKGIKVTEEMLLLVILSIMGMIVSMESYNLITLFLSIEITSICFYILVLNKNSRKGSIEGAIKYYIMGGIASTLLLLGAAIIYGESGALMYSDIFAYYIRNEVLTIGEIGMMLIVISLFIKIGMAPFHGWLIDTYEGTGLLMTFFLTLTQKVVIITILLNIYSNILSQIPTELLTKGIVMAIIATFIIGIIGGLRQQKLVRFVAYSGIVNSALLTLFVVGRAKEELVAYSMYYLITYIIGLIGLVIVVGGIVGKKINLNIQIFEELKSLWGINKIAAIILMLLLGYLAGLPPFSSFISKILLIVPLLQIENMGLFLIVVFAPVGIMVYYIQVIRYLVIDQKEANISNISYGLNSISKKIISICLLWIVFAQLYLDEVVGLLKVIVSTSI